MNSSAVRKAGYICRVSEEHQREHLLDQKEFIEEYAKKYDIELIACRMVVMKVWSKEYKLLCSELAQETIDNGGDEIIWANMSKAVRIKKWSPQNPTLRPTEEDMQAFRENIFQLRTNFVSEDDYHKEHSQITKLGKPGRPKKADQKSSELIREIRAISKQGGTIREIAKKLDISPSKVFRLKAKPKQGCR